MVFYHALLKVMPFELMVSKDLTHHQFKLADRVILE